jgi:hypothetical protein
MKPIGKLPSKRKRRGASRWSSRATFGAIISSFLILSYILFSSTNVSGKLFVKSFVYSLRASLSSRRTEAYADDEYVDEDEEYVSLDAYEDDEPDALDDDIVAGKSLGRQGSKEATEDSEDKSIEDDDELAQYSKKNPQKSAAENKPKSYSDAVAEIFGFQKKEWDAEKEAIGNTHEQRKELTKAKQRGTICVMFTTLFSSGDALKTLAQENTLRALSTLKPDIQTLVFTDDKRWIKFARSVGLEVEMRIHKNRYGTPYLHAMYLRAFQIPARFYGYTNGDILFGENLITTLQVIANEIDANKLHERLLITGRRLEHRLSFKDVISEDPYKANTRILQMAKMAQLGVRNAQDYFIVTRSTFNWNTMPKYVIGRPAYDNCLVHMVNVRSDISAVDSTSTVDAVHQVGRDGLKAGHKRRPDRGWNKVRCRGRWTRGLTNLMKYTTVFQDKRIICRVRKVESRGRLWNMFKAVLKPQMSIQEMGLVLNPLKVNSNVLIVEAFAYNSFVAKVANKAQGGRIVYLEMFRSCAASRKHLIRYKNVMHICAVPRGIQRVSGKPSVWADYKDLYESQLGPVKLKYDAIVVKGRARPQFAVWCLLNHMLANDGRVYMFDTASEGRVHYKMAEDFFSVLFEDKSEKGIKRLKAKPRESWPSLSFEDWLMEYKL